MTMLPLRDLSDMAPVQFPSFEEWCKSDIAVSALRAIHGVMAKAAPMYPTDVWREFPAQYHARKAHLHAMLAFEDIDSRDRGRKGGTPSTGLHNWEHALTRLAMVAHQYVPTGSVPTGDTTIVVDSRSDEVKSE